MHSLAQSSVMKTGLADGLSKKKEQEETEKDADNLVKRR